MTQSLLLEIGLEELPAQYVRTSSEQLAKRVEDFFKDENLAFESVEAFATPRRLAVRVNGLVEEQADREEIFKGPSLAIAQKDGAWTKAAEGFVHGQLVLRLSHLHEPPIFLELQMLLRIQMLSFHL